MLIALPASLWRRLIAAVYDGLLLLGLWFATTLLEIVVRAQLLGLPRHLLALQMLLLAVAALFFCLSWVRGGQTPGMRAWHLKVQRLDGAGLRPPVALVRFFCMLLTWAAALGPLLLLIPGIGVQPSVRYALLMGGLVALASGVAMGLGTQRRAICDWAAGTEVIQQAKDAR